MQVLALMQARMLVRVPGLAPEPPLELELGLELVLGPVPLSVPRWKAHKRRYSCPLVHPRRGVQAQWSPPRPTCTPR